jgi:hypothetical protein
VAPIVNSEISQEAEASEVVLNYLPEAEGIDQTTLKVGKDQASKEIEVASKVTLEGSSEVAEAGLMLLAITTTTETNFHPEDLKMMKDPVNSNQDPSEAVVVSEVVISKIEEAVECTQEEAATEAVALKAMRTEVEEAASVVKEVDSVVATTAKRAEVATVVASTVKRAVVEEVATVVVAMMEMRTEAVLEEDMLVLTPLPPSLLLRPEEEANLPTTER